jgi:hypothetical protein
MFYYLSFLRPPLLASPLSVPIALTPQVSNDLRTEAFPGAADVFYFWLDAASGLPLTAPAKLTTWREANAYKPVSASSPPVRARGAQCVLVLIPEPTHDAATIDLRAPDLGRAPFPVHSLPIAFGPKAGAGRKQESVERLFRLFDVVEDQPLLRIREMTSYDLDKVR